MYAIIALAALVVVIGAGRIVLQKVRRSQLRRTFGTFEGFVAEDPDDPVWVAGIFRYQQGKVEILKLRSISPLPIQVFKRDQLDITRIAEPDEQLLAQLPEKHVLVTAKYRKKRYLLAMPFDAYAGLSAWLEARQIMGFGRY